MYRYGLLLSDILATIVLFLIIGQVSAFWKHLPWGADDEIGATNRINPSTVLNAIKSVKTGKTYHLGIIIDSETPSFKPRILQISINQPNQVGRGKGGFGTNRFTYNDDILYGWLGTGSQIDGLGHAGIGNLFYNGNNRSNFALPDGLSELGLEKLPPIVTRGVLLDMALYYGVDIVPEGTAYTRNDIQQAAKNQGVEIKEGDVVLFHSGWLNVMDKEKDNDRYISVEPGLGVSGAWELVNKKVVAVGADTWGVEVVPPENANESFKAHQILITRNGIVLLENMDSRQLAKDKVYEFMFVLGFARIRGAAQMMINPIAIG